MSSPTDLPLRDGPRDECGVFGIYAPEHDVARLAYFALYALQHRGQESAGIAAADRGGYIITQRALGLVSRSSRSTTCARWAATWPIGHVRYSTTGSNEWENSQPVHRSAGSGGNRRELALAHNGNLINAVELHAELRERGVDLPVHLGLGDHRRAAGDAPGRRPRGRDRRRLPRLQGAFSTVVMTKDRVYAFRDPAGVRPLVLGQLGDRYCVASRDVRARHHRRRAPARRPARRARLARRRRHPHAAGRRRRARGVLRLRVHLLRAARLADGRATRCRPRAGAWARSWPARRPRPTPTS